jgi:hypothetical protein
VVSGRRLRSENQVSSENGCVSKMVGCSCRDCVYSASLDWANFEKGVVLCMHHHMGSIGNWAQRIVEGNQKPCEHFMSQSQKLGPEPNTELLSSD